MSVWSVWNSHKPNLCISEIPAKDHTLPLSMVQIHPSLLIWFFSTWSLYKFYCMYMYMYDYVVNFTVFSFRMSCRAWVWTRGISRLCHWRDLHWWKLRRLTKPFHISVKLYDWHLIASRLTTVCHCCLSNGHFAFTEFVLLLKSVIYVQQL